MDVQCLSKKEINLRRTVSWGQIRVSSSRRLCQQHLQSTQEETFCFGEYLSTFLKAIRHALYIKQQTFKDLLPGGKHLWFKDTFLVQNITDDILRSFWEHCSVSQTSCKEFWTFSFAFFVEHLLTFSSSQCFSERKSWTASLILRE